MLLSNAGDYTHSWWTYGLRDPRLVWSVQSNRYGLQFDVPGLNLTHLVRMNDAAIPDAPNASLACRIRVAGKTYRVIGGSADTNDTHLVESGRFFQRRTFTKLKWEAGCPALSDSSLEIVAWPDRLAFILRATPANDLRDAELEVSLTCINPFLPPDAPIPSRNHGTFRAPLGTAGEEQAAVALLGTHDTTDVRPAVVAVQTAPIEAALDVRYDAQMDWYEIALRNDQTGEPPHNDRIERVRVTIDNPSNVPQIVHLNFAKGSPLPSEVFGIVGISAVLRDMDGNPAGLPVQLSKNWHDKPDRYKGPWYRGLTMVTVPANRTIEFEYTGVNAHWGGVAAASHAQLSLVGWGVNQLWEQAAIGSWGESICFEPDQSHSCAVVTDTRPLMTYETPGIKWGWTGNCGGANFLELFDKAGTLQWNSAMKTDFKRYCPVLTEVAHSGRTHDGGIALQYTVSLYRTDDLTRGIYHFRYEVRRPTAFSRLVLFQCGADRYSTSSEKKLAFGDETGLLSEWQAQWEGGTYKTEPVEITGKIRWFSMHDVERRAMASSANKGFVIRQWDARLGGKPANPWAAERGTTVFEIPSSIIELMPPPDVKSLQPGDYVECVIEHVVMPQFADDYYGPNAALRAALQRDQNSWRMIYREALGNDLDIAVAKGTLLRRRPTLIQARDDAAEFSITGGLGYVPVTLAGLKNYRNPVLEMLDGDRWVKIDQSVHGNDFWQTDYDALTRTWEVTYSIPMDSESDRRAARDFRFRI